MEGCPIASLRPPPEFSLIEATKHDTWSRPRFEPDVMERRLRLYLNFPGGFPFPRIRVRRINDIQPNILLLYFLAPPTT
jgi:hypothetical protein